MLTIGVVGPEDSVSRILDTANQLDYKVQFVPYVYEDIIEAPAIVGANTPKVNGWLFSGPAPFMLVRDTLGHAENYVYCSFNGAGLYKCFLQIAQDQNRILERLSIDIPESESLQEAIDELGIPLKESYINPFGSQTQAQDLMDFHISLWEQGKTDGAISSLGAVHRALQQRNIPVYRNTVTAVSIREAIQVVVQKTTASYFKDTQVGFQIIEISNYDEIAAKTTNPYDLQYLELKIKRDLVRLSQKLNGRLLEQGQGRYEIFSSRGGIEREIGTLRDITQKISYDVNAPVAVGIGFGNTVLAAESNARKALLHANKRQAERIIIIQEDGMLVESLGPNREITYDSQTNDSELLEKLHQVKVSIKTLRKIEATVQHLGWTTFTSAQLASELSVSERNIRRILSGLSEVSLVTCIGEGYSSVRGRPSKLYRLA